MKRKDIMNILHNQEKIFEKNVHDMIAKELGVKKLYSKSNLWCEITDIDFRFKYLQKHHSKNRRAFNKFRIFA